MNIEVKQEEGESAVKQSDSHYVTSDDIFRVFNKRTVEAG
jgi:hypothetical protein